MITPLGHKILVKVDPVEETTKGGIVLVQDERLERAASIIGTLVAVGPSAWEAFRSVDAEGRWVNGAPWAKIGDRVIYSRHAGTTQQDPEDDEWYVILHDEDLAAVITGEKDG